MTERLNCGNCGGPLVRQGGETSSKCAHCEHTTEVGSGGSDSDPDIDSDDGRDRGHVPAILVINAGGGQQQSAPPQVVTRTVVVRQGSSFSFITPIIILAIIVGTSLAIRRHVMRSIPSIPNPAEVGHEPPHPDPHKHH